jgi:addiction module HigA family antidote
VPHSSADIGLTANALAKAIGVPPNRITAILKDERGTTGDTAIRLGTFFKTSAEFWMNDRNKSIFMPDSKIL